MTQAYHTLSRGQWPHFSPLICECVANNYTPVMITAVTQCTWRANTHNTVTPLHFISRSSEDTHVSVSALAGPSLCQCVFHLRYAKYSSINAPCLQKGGSNDRGVKNILIKTNRLIIIRAYYYY